MYDRLTPLFRDVTDAQLIPSTDGTGFYKSAALVDENDPSLITSENIAGTAPGAGAVSARIKRDAYGVPHIYSDTDPGVIFAAGYVVAADRSLLLDQARANAVAGLIDMPGVPAIQLVLGLYTYKPTKKVLDQATALQTKSIEAQGAPGRQLLSDIDVYLAGINLWYSQNSPTTPPFTRTDIYALNALKSQFLGQGGGEEVANAQFLDAARSKLGATRGDEAYEDLRGRYDPETATTTTRKLPVRRPRSSVAKPRGMVRIVNGSFRSTAPKLPASTRAAAARAATVDHPYGPPQLAQQHPDREREGVADRLAALRGRPADRLQLPRPDAGDGPPRARHPRARRDVGAVPRLHAHRARRGLRVDADLGRRATSSTRTPRRSAAARRCATSTRASAGRWSRSTPARSPRAARACTSSSGARSMGRSTATRRRAAATRWWRCRPGARATGARRSTSSSSSR